MPTAILFDLDGTLVDSRADLATGANLMRADHGLAPLPVAQIVSYVGNGIRKLVERTLADRPELDVTAGVSAMKRHYLAHLLDETRAYPRVGACLARLAKAGILLGVVTNKPEEPARRICEALDLAQFLPVIVGGDTCPVLKPSPEPVLFALDQLGPEAKGIWFVGDNYTDLQAGAAAGMKTCFCRFGFGKTAGEMPDLAVDSLTEFTDHVLRAETKLD